MDDKKYVKMKIRRFEDGDRKCFSEVPEKSVSGELGFTVVMGSDPVACGFLIPTSTEICLYEFVDANPKFSTYTKAKAIKILTHSVERLAKEMGFKLLLGYVPSENRTLLEFYKRIDNVTITKKTYRAVIKEL